MTSFQIKLIASAVLVLVAAATNLNCHWLDRRWQ